MNFISSKENQNIKDMVRLFSSKKTRREKGLFVVEGVRICMEISSCGCVLEKLFVTQEARRKYGANVVQLEKLACESFEITVEIAEKISDTKTPQGVFAIFRSQKKEIALYSEGHYLLLCSLQDPGNLGTIVRSCDAFQMDGLLITEDCVDVFNPKVLRSTMGTVLRVPIQQFSTAKSAVEALRRHNITIYATALHEDAVPITMLPMEKGGCVMIGNEGNGLQPEEIALADQQTVIPMGPQSESLNVAVAASIIAWEMQKHRMDGSIS